MTFDRSRINTNVGQAVEDNSILNGNCDSCSSITCNHPYSVLFNAKRSIKGTVFCGNFLIPIASHVNTSAFMTYTRLIILGHFFMYNS